MLKKTLLSAAIASTFALSGCLDSSPETGENAGSVTNPDTESSKFVFPVFSPVESKLPIPNDLIFDSEAGDGSFLVGDTSPPVTTALNGLSGASTIAPIDVALSGLIDPASLKGPGDPDQNVWLVELDYASGDALRGLLIQEPPQPAGSADQPMYKVEEITLDGTSFVRINLVEPLDPLKRYIVALTDGITDLSGDAIAQSPGAAGYEVLTKDDSEIPLTGALLALSSVRALINGLWEPASLGYINAVRGAYSQPALTPDNLALTYSFTTSGDEKVLNYIADPKQWFNDQLTRFLRVSAIEATSPPNYATALETAEGSVTLFPSDEIKAALPTLFGSGAPCEPLTGAVAVGCVSTALTANLGAVALGTPTATSIDFPTQTAPGGTFDAKLVNAALPAGVVSLVQGTMTVPYYSGLPTDAELGPSALKYKSWVPNEELATILNYQFYNIGLSIPQGRTAPAQDANGDDFAPVINPPLLTDFTVAAKSSVVNYNFPFPAKQGDVAIPVLAMYPTAAAGDMKTMVWGHGLTGNRTNALGFGASLVATAKAGLATDVAVIAIDQPLHGVDVDTNPLYVADSERHFDLFAVAGQTVPTPLDLTTEGGSGSMFVNIESFLTTRDSNRQNVLDLLTLRKSIGNIDFAIAAGDVPDPDPALGVFYSGHSLGTISAQAFVAVANDTNQTEADGVTPATSDNIAAAAFFTPGGGITRFFENSPAFAGDIIDGLGAQGVTTDSSSYQAYLNVLQAASDAFDAVNFVGEDGFKNTPVLYVEAVSDLVIPVSQNAEDRTYNAVTSNGFTIAGSVSYLSGAEPLARLSGADQNPIETAGQVALNQAVIRYNTCAMDHGTPSSATSPTAGDVPAAAYTENVNHVAEIVATGGATVTLSDASLIEATPLPAWIDNSDDRTAFCNSTP